jgi:hypothetical protein
MIAITECAIHTLMIDPVSYLQTDRIGLEIAAGEGVLLIAAFILSDANNDAK